MNRIFIFLILLGSLNFGCQSHTGTGVLAGGALGAGIGGIAGGGKGALIGGAAGVIAGGLVGAALDEQNRKIMDQRSPRTVERMERGQPLTVDDVIQLSEGGISDDTIMDYIRSTGTRYNLTQTQIRRMQNTGVTSRVINYMIDTGY